MPNGISEKEQALIEAARRDLERMRAQPAEEAPLTPAAAPAPARPAGVSQVNSAPASSPDAPAAQSGNVPGSTSPDAIAVRIAVLMEAEREEKARRLKSQQRWKTGAIGLFVALAGWWALTIISHLRH